MEQKADGRLYSRVLRRSVSVLQSIDSTRLFTLKEISQEIFDNKNQEFYLSRLGRTISINRIGDYLRFLVEIGAFEKVNEKYKLAVQPKTVDKDWIIVFSDLGWNYLAVKTNLSHDNFKKRLLEILIDFHNQRYLPMLPDIIDEFGISSGQKEEFFRWALYLYTDADSCPFDVRHFPVMIEKTKKYV